MNLTSALGQFERNLVKILQGQYCSDTTQLTSRNAGDVLIRAKAGIDLAADESKVTFPSFPWHLVLLAAVGGLVGALVASSSGLASGRWWASVWRSLVLGAVLGVAFYLFTFFGAFVLPKYVPLNLQNIPTVSAIGATLLGFVGGLYGRKLWKVDGGDAPPAIKDEKAA